MNWKGIIDERDLKVAKLSGQGKRMGWGTSPALLVIDAQYDFAGVDGPIEDSIKVYPRSVGADAWGAAVKIKALLSAARKADLPVYFSQQWNPPEERRFDSFAAKQKLTGNEPERMGLPAPADIMSELRPRRGEVVIKKRFASIFNGTPAQSFLVREGVDTLIVCGFVTSGCVRGTVVDGHSLCYRNIVAADACADRFRISHYTSLFDMDMKYADVLDTSEIVSHIRGKDAK